MELEIGYGTISQKVAVEPQNLAGVILPNKVPVPKSEEEIIRKALDGPLDTKPLEEIAFGQEAGGNYYK